jgi:hypothetical protein
MMKNFNDTHPELQEGEVFLMNLLNFKEGDSDFMLREDEETYRNLPYRSKRVGTNAYTTKGEPMPDSIPVFVLKSELKS